MSRLRTARTEWARRQVLSGGWAVFVRSSDIVVVREPNLTATLFVRWVHRVSSTLLFAQSPIQAGNTYCVRPAFCCCPHGICPSLPRRPNSVLLLSAIRKEVLRVRLIATRFDVILVNRLVSHRTWQVASTRSDGRLRSARKLAFRPTVTAGQRLLGYRTRIACILFCGAQLEKWLGVQRRQSRQTVSGCRIRPCVDWCAAKVESNWTQACGLAMNLHTTYGRRPTKQKLTSRRGLCLQTTIHIAATSPASLCQLLDVHLTRCESAHELFLDPKPL